MTPTLEILTHLQRFHLLNVPFENLDIHYDTPIELDIQKLYNKIVLNKRGGFCYELNGLFFELLARIGFDAKRISARVYNSDSNEYSEEYDHMAIVVNIADEDYLADVGFSEFAFGPLKIEFNQLQHDERGSFLFDKYDNDYLRVSKMTDGKPIPEYIFTTQPREPDEFSGMCRYHQTSPLSHFTLNKMISLPLENGRVTLTESNLKITRNGHIENSAISGEEEFREKLDEYFDIDKRMNLKITGK